MSLEREERLFRLHEALQADLERGALQADSVYGQRFDLEPQEVARARRALELLCDPEPLLEDLAELPEPELPEDYEISGELGRGGMGVVYRVHQKSLDRDLALKVLRPGEAVARRALERFQREARSLARLRHPHIASVHEVGECGGRVYFTMDLIEGRSLAQHIREGSVTPSQAVRWMRQVTSAMQYVHSHGLVHRDIKPANILIDEAGDAHVVDFGLAREVEVASELTQSGHFLGTPAYMAPEQARGEAEAVGEATDVYAIGAVLYECLTGERAFSGASLVELIAAVCEGDPRPPSRLDPKVPRGLERICLKAMARERGERYVTARALLEDIERFEAGLPVLAEPPSWRKRWRTFVQRNRASLVAGVGTAVATAALFVLLLSSILGSGSQRLLEAARELQQSGEARAAAQLYAQAYPQQADFQTLRDHGLVYMAALLELADGPASGGDGDLQRESAQRLRELARGSLQRLEGLAPRSREGTLTLVRLRLELLALETRALLHLGQEPDYDELAVAAGELGRQAPGGDASESPLGAGGASSLFLARSSLPMLLERESAAHDAALVLWRRALTGSERSEVQRWLRSEAPEREAVLAALLASADALRAAEGEAAVPRLSGRHQLEWMGLVDACEPRRLREALRAALDAQPGSQDLRGFVADLLDLPPGLLPQVDSGELGLLLDPERYDPRLDLERRLDLALRVVEEQRELWSDELEGWLRQRVGVYLPRGAGDALTAWRAWRRELGAGGLRAVLDGALGLAPDAPAPDAAAWLRRLDTTSGPLERRLLHERLHHELPGGEFAPHWPASFGGEPPGLAGLWHARLASLAPARAWRLRLAALRWELGATEPVLVWDDQRRVTEGSELRPRVELELSEWVDEPSLMERFVQLVEPGHATRRAPATVQLEGRLGWERGGLELRWWRPRLTGSLLFLRSAGRGNVTVAPGEVASCGLFLHRRRGQAMPVAHELILSLVEPEEAPARPWSLADWRARVAEQVQRAAESGTGRPPLTRLEGPLARLETRWLAQMLGLEPAPEVAQAAGDPGGILLRRWVACGDAQERARLFEASGFARYPSELRLELARAARESGGELDAGAAALLRRDEAARASQNRKHTVLWIVGGVFAFLIAGLLFAAARGTWRFVASGELGRRWREVRPEERVVSGLAMLPSSLVWVWYADGFGRYTSTGGTVWNLALALFELYVAAVFAYLGSGLTSRLRQLPALLVGASALIVLGQTLGAFGAQGTPWPHGAAGLCLWLALLVFPLNLRELWRWDPRPELGQRRERRASVIYVLAVLLPFGWRVFGPGPGVGGHLGEELSAVGLALTLAPIFGLLGWGILLFRSTKTRRTELMQAAAERHRARQRAARAST